MCNGKAYKGACFCGAVQFTVGGEPAAMGYCHCDSCRSWSAEPVNAFTLWEPEAVQITRGADNIGTYNKTPRRRSAPGTASSPSATHHRRTGSKCSAPTMAR